MMKKIFTLCYLSMACATGFSQAIERDVVASAGNYSSVGNLSISSTFGEVFVATTSNNTITLTQGFQQPTEKAVVDSVESVADPLGTISVYPNPTKGLFTIDVTDVLLNEPVEIINMLGEQVGRFNITGNRTNVKLDVESGVYMVVIKGTAKRLTVID